MRSYKPLKSANMTKLKIEICAGVPSCETDRSPHPLWRSGPAVGGGRNWWGQAGGVMLALAGQGQGKVKSVGGCNSLAVAFAAKDTSPLARIATRRGKRGMWGIYASRKIQAVCGAGGNYGGISSKPN